ncbi:DNA helicase PcrA [Clostridium cellulovorans]|uniref:ATP-dependent DNA helicase n=1 Tax=Clostridium cellulovorans (strain ATCC 35296 / DSM 3052 / OCM 3 / 743B) TaxID=573061 RepID=D9SVK0_CLOC7|nr:DNA helicase PcrA [Clostridium cellulovorans]ADL51124.1 UvrD/REP helicase [Clostridium cellulovorans 743B]
MDLRKLLNQEQYKAATTIEGPLLILAGAGSGKTRVLTYRIAHMIKELGIYSSQILAITFTNKAAQEMRERIRGIVGDVVDNMWVSTFHSSCVRILRREIDKIGYNKNFTIYDTYDQKTLLKQCMKELNINDKEITDKEILSKIGGAKDNLISAESYKRINEKNFRENKIADVYLLYQKKLKQNNALDFDDLIFKTVELFEKSSEVLEFYQRKFKYIMIDEYQDTNYSQYKFAKLLAAKEKNICVVGDDDQSIYGWRGADIRNILNFEKDYDKATIIKLEENYRSKANILEAANSVIKNNPHKHEKVLRTTNESGDKIRIYRGSNDIDEGRFVAVEIERLKEIDSRRYKDYSILYRTNAQSRIFEDIFVKANIPYRIIGGLKFYDRKEIKDIMAYLKLINNPSDDVSLQRIINVPKRSIGDTTVNKLVDFAAFEEEPIYSILLDVDLVPGLTPRAVTSLNKFTSLINSFIRRKDSISVSDLIKEILNESGYLAELKDSKDVEDISRIENLKQLVSAAVEFERTEEDTSLAAFLEKTTLVADVDNYDEDADTVTMMTVHSAKGLEFPVVFMVGMENGIFPGSASFNEDSEMEESRRLCYVGITRAKEKLYMTSAESRNVFGRTVFYAPSDFLTEIKEDQKEYLNSIPAFNDGYRMQQEKPRIDYFSKLKSEDKTDVFGSLEYSKSFDTASPIKKNEVKTLTENEAKMGIKVKHSKFGIGTIITVLKKDGKINLTIAFQNNGVKNLRLDMAPLEVV